jgi:protein O-GlcNAcase/histone acetyltransferase
MTEWGLNTYLYAPKDDLKHRSLWRVPYSPGEAEPFRALLGACADKELRFVYALSPGLDIRYHRPADQEALQQRFEQMLGLGCQHFCLLFDDIPDQMDAEDLRRWGSLAAAQAAVANAVFRWTRERQPQARFLFCPTPYCGRMAERQHGGLNYLPTLGRELAPGIDVLWTGPEIVSRDIPLPHLAELQSVLRRKPVLWDNLHANDYDGRRFFCGPYAGRSRELLEAAGGVLSNPNCEFPLNYIPLRTLGEFVHGQGPWDPRDAYLRALKSWREQFVLEGNGSKPDLEDLTLFGDCFYLPHQEGPLAEALYQSWRQLLSEAPARWGERAADLRRRAARLREFCARTAELRHRALFHALGRRSWELREEMDLLERGLAVNEEASRSSAFTPFASDAHLPGTYRGGFVARFQQLLHPLPDGTFVPSTTCQ